MKKIIIVGVGQLGFRHAQSFLEFDESVEVNLIEPSMEQLEKVMKELRTGQVNTKTKFIGLDKLPLGEVFDLGIIATNSDVRFDVASQLVNRNVVSNLVLEKNVFQREADFDMFFKLIQCKEIKTWINCPMRSFEVYQSLKVELDKEDGVLEVDISGNDWGLACNSIHYIDLVSFLSNGLGVSLIGKELEVIPSKRHGFIEFYGTVIVSFDNNSTIKLTCSKGNKFSRVIKLRKGKLSYLLKETESKVEKYYGSDLLEVSQLNFPFQSQMTAGIAKLIFDDDKIVPLPRFEETMELHKVYIDFFLERQNELTGSNNMSCNIT